MQIECENLVQRYLQGLSWNIASSVFPEIKFRCFRPETLAPQHSHHSHMSHRCLFLWHHTSQYCYVSVHLFLLFPAKYVHFPVSQAQVWNTGGPWPGGLITQPGPGICAVLGSPAYSNSNMNFKVNTPLSQLSQSHSKCISLVKFLYNLYLQVFLVLTLVVLVASAAKGRYRDS